MPTGERLTQVGAWQVIRQGRPKVFNVFLSGWQQRTVSLMTTGQQWVKSSPSEEFLSPGVPWYILVVQSSLKVIHFIFEGKQQVERDL